MQTNTLRTSIVIVLSVVAASVLYFVQFSGSNLPQSSAETALDAAESSRPMLVMPNVPMGAPLLEREAFKREMIQKLLAEYGESIAQISVQVALIDFRSYVIESFPADGRLLFEEIIRAAFPQLADAILDALARMDQYNQWLLDNMLALNELSPLERKGRIWEQRTQLFGEQAKVIWSDELTAAAEQQANMQKSLELLNVAYDIDINERLFLLKSAMEENYAQLFDGMMLEQGVLGKVFFGLDSVQRDLSAMTSETRQQQIDAIRRNLGYTEEQITAAAEQDQKKEQRWQNGYQYMAEREALVSTASGDELEQELAALREKFFKTEAKTITLEEQDGFFRFNRPRLYGRN